MGEEGKKILITGGSGFIGRHLAKKILDSGHQVCIYDLAEPPMKELKKVSVVGDVFNLKKLDEAVKNHDIIIHMVGLPDGVIAQKEPQKSFELNVLSLQNVLEVCRKNEGKKLIFPSSASVYGMPKDLPIKESFELDPMGTYAWHKYLCEKMVEMYHENYGIDYVVLRLFNVYGSGHRGVIEIFLEKAKKGETIISFGPYQYRDFVYAGDVAEVTYTAAMYFKADNRVVNIGSGRGTQIRDLLDVICEMYPKAKWIEKRAEAEFYYDSIADITLAKILLDFKPHDKLEFMKNIIEKEMMIEKDIRFD